MNGNIPLIPVDSAPAEILRIGIEAASGPVKLACSFSVEDLAIIDITLEQAAPRARGMYMRCTNLERKDTCSQIRMQ